MKRIGTIIVLVALLVSGCATARQQAIVIDQAFAATVFALDDARAAACGAHFYSEADCAKLVPIMRKALVDVQSVTNAVKAMPQDGTIPKSLPDLLRDLHEAQAIIAALAPIVPTDLSAKASAADAAAIALLTQLTNGGKS